jgi:hypothetical protein
MNIIAEYDSSANNAPSGFKAAVQAAINYYDQLILNPITVKIVFSYGEIEGQSLDSDALGESSTNGNIETFSLLKSQLTTAATSQAEITAVGTLPATDPTGGARFWVSDTEAKVFGVGSEPGFTDPEDGFVGLSSTYSFSYDPTNRAVSGEFDAIGVLEHEISEALGRVGYLGTGSFDGYNLYGPIDLYRYSSPGVRDLNYQGAYFSYNGQTMLSPFNDPNDGADVADWAESVYGDSYGYGSQGQAGVVTPTDALVMETLGFNVSSPTNSDFNGDQKSDLLIENTSGAVVVGEVGSNGQEAYTQVAALGSAWTFHGSGDFLGDGNTDFLIQNTNGAVVLGEVANGATTYAQVGALGPEWTFKGVGDFLGDGLSDFLIKNTSGAVVVGEVVSGQVTYTQVAALGPEWTFEGVGEFNGDSKSDFLIENTSGAVVVGEVMNGQASYTQVGALGSVWSFEGVGDFLGVGDSQFLIENSSNGAVVLGQVIDGTAHYTQIGGLGPQWVFEGVGDYLGAGVSRFLIENSSTGALVVGSVSNGQAQYTQVGGLGSGWSFHS